MTSRRYVILGLAHPRSAWFRSVAQWCNGGALPAEFVKCLGPTEVRQRLDDGRTFSTLLVDGGLSGVDRDLFTAAGLAGCAVIVVGDPRIDREWTALGATAVLEPDFSRASLLDALATHTRLVDRSITASHINNDVDTVLPTGKVVAVVGSGGTGTSTVAIAIAQGIAQGNTSSKTLLADFRLNAEQAMLHDATDLTGGLQSLVDAVRSSDLRAERISEFSLRVPQRGYDLLTGIRRARFWASIRPVAFTAAFAGLMRAYDTVVCDVDPDLETEESGGSQDIEERSTMSRTALKEAHAVVVVGHPSMKGLHSMNRLLIDLGDAGVPTDRLLCVFNHAPKAPRARAGYVAALAELITWREGQQPSFTPVHLPTRDIDEILRAGDPLPTSLTTTMARALAPLLSGSPVMNKRSQGFSRIRPGSLHRSVASELA